MLAAAALSAQSVSAQTVEASKTFFDNWYIGVNGGVSTFGKNHQVLKNITPEASLRVGRWITPVFGLAAEGTVNFGKDYGDYKAGYPKFDNVHPNTLDQFVYFYGNKTFIKNVRVSLLGTTNFSNWFGGYKGQPRTFEVIGIYGLGWQHAFGGFKRKEVKTNFWTAKFGMDFTFNLGKAKAWQIYVEPNIVYDLETHKGTQMNLNYSRIGVLAGVNYKFGNSNGTHNFKIAELKDQAEIDGLNAKINELRSTVNAKDGQLSAKDAKIRDLENALRDCQNKKPAAAVKPATATNLQPTVLFRQGKATIDAAQYAPIELIANYMKNHKDAKIEIKGYASPEGNAAFNQKLSQKRADAVKNALVKKYKIAADRLNAVGCGVTDKLFEEVEFNRVATFNDSAK